MKKYKIGVWGQYGDGGKIADGQAVRTTIITKELQYRYGESEVAVVNTNNWKAHPLRFLWNSIKLITQSETVAIAPADNGFKVFVPILVFINFFFRRQLIYIVIGGFLPALLKEHPFYVKLVKRFDALFVQTENLRKDISAFGISNIYILSNLKRINTRSKDEIKVNAKIPLKLCTFSRVCEEKGIYDAVEAVKIANERLGSTIFTLDIYGLLPDDFKANLQKLLNENKSILSYRGIADYDKTVDVLKEYYALLFPTFYYGEGFPGNVIDAFNSGLPIIATDWLYNKDVIADGVNGILVPIHSPEKISDAIIDLYNDKEKHYKISWNNIDSASRYSPDAVMAEFYSIVEMKNKSVNN